jgi:hypothetical protein
MRCGATTFRLLARAHGCIPAPMAASMFEALERVAAGEGWTLASSSALVSAWDRVVTRPARDIERVLVAAMWSDAMRASTPCRWPRP